MGTLSHPYRMSGSSSANTYVADSAGNSLSKLTPSGALSAGFLSADSSPLRTFDLGCSDLGAKTPTFPAINFAVSSVVTTGGQVAPR